MLAIHLNLHLNLDSFMDLVWLRARLLTRNHEARHCTSNFQIWLASINRLNNNKCFKNLFLYGEMRSVYLTIVKKQTWTCLQLFMQKQDNIPPRLDVCERITNTTANESRFQNLEKLTWPQNTIRDAKSQSFPPRILPAGGRGGNGCEQASKDLVLQPTHVTIRAGY